VSDPVPANLWEAFKAFMAAGKTGQFTFNVNSGRAESVEVRERVKALATGKVDKTVVSRTQ
jgi:hypothetical protein